MCTASIRSARPVTPASGSPPAIALPVVIRSGTTPSNSLANQLPVRQKPVWISSAMNTMPCAEHHSATRATNPGAGTMKPPSPWIGSRITAAVRSSPTWVCTWDTNVSKASSAQRSGPVGQRYG